MKKTKILLTIFFIFSITMVLSDEPIIFITLPKSGSVYISQTLSQGLKKPFFGVSHDTFPKDPIISTKLFSLIQCNGITQEHLDASDHNLSLLKKFNLKAIIHVRDPRQSLISWTHHLNTHKNDPGLLSLITPTPPKTYFDLSFSKQLDWQIETFLPIFIEWIKGWVKAKEQNEIDIKFTTYESFHENPTNYYNEVLKFFQIPIYNFSDPLLPKNMSYHYREGTPDEWKSVLSEKQQQKANAMIPEEFFTLFNWKR